MRTCLLGTTAIVDPAKKDSPDCPELSLCSHSGICKSAKLSEDFSLPTYHKLSIIYAKIGTSDLSGIFKRVSEKKPPADIQLAPSPSSTQMTKTQA